MGPIVDPKDVKNDEPRTAQAANAEACSRDCQESSALCTWPNCNCPASIRAEGTLYSSAVGKAA